MPRSRNALLALLRGLVLGAAFASMFAVDGVGLHGLHVDMGRGILLLFAVGLLLPRGTLVRPTVPLIVLAADLVAIGTVGTFLYVPDAPNIPPLASVPFLAGYVVATLVAVTGRRVAAGGLGALAGAMLLVLGESALETGGKVTPGQPGETASQSAAAALAEARDPAGPVDERDRFLALRLLLLAAAAIECAAVTGWIDADVRRRRTAESVDREIRARETLAGEMATFIEAAKAARWLPDLVEALVAHLRRHFPTRARGLVLEDGVSRTCVWEEAGKLDADLTESRRIRLQDALREAGSQSLVQQMDVRATTNKPISKEEHLLTGVGVPVHSGGRVAGVIFVTDPRRRALSEDRIGALAELARQVGDTIQRLDRARDEQTRRTALLLGQMREGVLLVGPDGRLLLSNAAGREILKAMGQDAEGEVAVGDLSPRDLAAIPAGAVRRTSAIVKGPEEREARFAASAVGVVDGGARLGTLATLPDVTDEERARERLMQAEKLSVVGQTLASVAHELNNPLAAIVGYADLLTDAHVPPDVEKILGRIREQSVRTSRIVKNLLSVARRRGPERAPVLVNEIAQSVIDLFSYEARLSNITIVTDLSPEVVPISADRHALQQVLVNLVQNALQALRGLGRQAGAKIVVRTRPCDGSIALSVIDDGPGVRPEHRARIFEPFFTTKGPNEGTGLGLAIARGIARDHGGELLLEPREDGKPGAQFTMRLPVGIDEPDPVTVPAHEVPGGIPDHVLVIDDEAPVRDSLSAQLRRLGAKVESAATPLEATRMMDATSSYDAVLMDLRLPGQSGLDLHRALRARNPGLAKKVVFMTGDLVNADLLKAVRETGNPLLEKPFSAAELCGALNQVRVPTS